MHIWKYINLLSIDIAIGAVIGCAFFGHILAVSILPHAFMALGLSVWIIYTADHLNDAYKLTSRGQTGSTDRHRFHQIHFSKLLVVVIGAAFLAGLEVFYVKPPVRIAGLALAVPVAMYLIGQHRLRFTKEIFGAVLYTAGIVLVPLALLHRLPAVPEAVLIALYGLTALANLLLFSLMDLSADVKDQNTSFASIMGIKRAQRYFFSLTVLNAIGCLGVGVFVDHVFLPAMVILAMNVILGYVGLRRKELAYGDRYRIIADAIFFIPLVGLLV
jgi:hypothetical protein